MITLLINFNLVFFMLFITLFSFTIVLYTILMIKDFIVHELTRLIILFKIKKNNYINKKILEELDKHEY